MSQLNFDATQVAPQQPLEPVPSGWYIAAMTESELVPTAAGDGLRLKYELTIIDGPYKGRKVFDGLNIKNQNPQAQEIAHQQLSAICHAVGTLRIQQSEELHNKPLGVKVVLEPQRADANDPSKIYEARNQVKGFKPAVEVTSSPGNGAASAPVATNGAPAPATPPWAAGNAAKPAAAATPAPAAATTSTAVPPWLAGKTAAAPAPAPAAPAPAPASAAAPATEAPKGPKGPGKKKAAAPAERRFFVYIDDNNMPLKTEAEVIAMIAQGMPEDTMVAPEGTEDWKTPAEHGVSPKATPAAEAASTGKPPWAR